MSYSRCPSAQLQRGMLQVSRDFLGNLISLFLGSSFFLKSLSNFLIIGLKIFLAKAASAPKEIANRIANAPYKNGTSFENFTVNSAKAFRSGLIV